MDTEKLFKQRTQERMFELVVKTPAFCIRAPGFNSRLHTCQLLANVDPGRRQVMAPELGWIEFLAPDFDLAQQRALWIFAKSSLSLPLPLSLCLCLSVYLSLSASQISKQIIKNARTHVVVKWYNHLMVMLQIIKCQRPPRRPKLRVKFPL